METQPLHATLEHEAYRLLQGAGLDVPRHLFVPRGQALNPDDLADLDAAKLVVKVVSQDIAHKSDAGGVRFVDNDFEAVRRAIDEVLRASAKAAPAARLQGTLIVEQIRHRADVPGTELLISLRHDAAFGWVLLISLGGLLTEWYGRALAERGRLILPALDFDLEQAARDWSRSLAGLLSNAPSRVHARPPIELPQLSAFLAGMQRIARSESDLLELELNPVVACEGRLIALDALARRGPIAPVQAARRSQDSIHRLLHPRSAVVYGASTNAMNAGRIILRNLKQAEGLDYGQLTAIHPSAERIDGVPCLRCARDLAQPVDLAVVAVPAESAAAVVETLVTNQRARSIILIPGGFAESGRADLEQRIRQCLARAREKSADAPVLLGGNCLGIVSKAEYNTFFLPSYKLPWHAAPGDGLVVVSQSGAYLVTLSSQLDGVVYPRASISYGNEVDLGPADFLEYYLEREPDVRIFAFYIEGLRPGEGERLRALVARASALGKQVLMVKSGRTERGASAAASHSASMAGDYTLFRDLMQGAGALVCDTLNMFEDYTKVFTMLADRRAQGRRLGVVTNAGFETATVSDRLGRLEAASLNDATRAALRAALPEIAYTGNPVDTTPMADTKSFVRAVELMAAADEVDLLIVSAVPQTPALDVLAPDLSGVHGENMFGLHSLPTELIRIFRSTSKPMVVTIDAGRLYDAPALVLERAGIPVFRKIDRASRALSAFVGAID